MYTPKEKNVKKYVTLKAFCRAFGAAERPISHYRNILFIKNVSFILNLPQMVAMGGYVQKDKSFSQFSFTRNLSLGVL